MQIVLGNEEHAVPASAVIGLMGAGEVAGAVGVDALDPVGRAMALAELEARRRRGEGVLLLSNCEQTLRSAADEVWWIENGAVRMKGDPAEVLQACARYVAERLRASAAPVEVMPSMRRGDGRAELESIETLDSDGRAVSQWMSGETAVIRVTVRFREAVADPVVGIMIRTRIGMEVYGTNTELEHVQLGPCVAGDRRVVEFRFACTLCPQSYSITAASHDPDGVWHDWMEDAVAFMVADTRYTAGVANLRAQVTASSGT